MMDSGRLTRACLVTGGSRGIGAACSVRLARDGYAVAVNYRSDEAAAKRIVAEIVDGGGVAVALQADVSSEAGVTSLFEQLDAAKLPPLAALVNNAAVVGYTGSFESTTTEAFTTMMSTNVLGPFLCCREAAVRMQPGSAIVNISSGSAYIGTPLLYSMSKGALNSMQVGLIKPLAAKGIRINTVSPGLTETDMTQPLRNDPEKQAGLMAQIPLGRAGKPAEIAGAVSFLLSPDASYTCGANIRVAGGRGPGTMLG